MARPTKQGLDYFPFDVDFFDDPKIENIQVDFEGEGVWVILKTLAGIYRNGYFTQVDDRFFQNGSRTKFYSAVSPERFREIIESACQCGFFDEKLYREYKILTSAGIQKRFVAAKKLTRQKIEIDARFNLIPTTEEVSSGFFGGNDVSNGVSSEETPDGGGVSSEETPDGGGVSSGKSAQKKRKEKKLNNNTPLTPLTGEEEREGGLCDFDEKTILSGDPLISEIVDAWNKVFPKEHPQHFNGTIGELNTVFLENLRRTRKEYSDAKTFATVFEEIRASPDLTIPLHSAVKLENVKIFLTKNYNKTHGLTGRTISGSDEIRANRFNGSYSNPDNYTWESIYD